MIRRWFAACLVALGAAVGCSGPKDPSSVADKKISELSTEDIRGICAYNVQAYRSTFPMEDWDTALCGGVTMLQIVAKDKLMEVHDVKVSRDDCAFQLGECGFSPRYEILTPEQDCERVDPDRTRACQATVAELQACLQERTDRTKEVNKIVRDKSLCDSKTPMKDVDIFSGPGCQKIKAMCPEFNYALPGAIRGIQ